MRATEIAPGTVLKSKPVRVWGRIVAQRVLRELDDGRLESETYPLYAAQGLVGADLTLMDPSFSGDRGSIAVVRARYEAEVNEYETRYASLLDVA